MTWTARCAATVLLLSGATVHAEDMQVGLPGLYEAERFDWKGVNHDMSTREYWESSSYNQQIFGSAAREVFQDSLRSFGMSKQSVEITGAAVGFAIKGTTLDLNESKTLTLEIDDVITRDRAIFFNIQLEW